jgi:hypothetical protein
MLFGLSSASFAEVKTIKFDENFHIKFQSDIWNYHYIKAMNAITPHIFEYKDNKDLKVIVQKETHLDKNPKNIRLVEEKCLEAQKSYQDTKTGTAKTIKIKNKNVCLIQLEKIGRNNYQIIFPIHFTANSYDLVSFSWSDNDDGKLKLVNQLVGENL